MTGVAFYPIHAGGSNESFNSRNCTTYSQSVHHLTSIDGCFKGQVIFSESETGALYILLDPIWSLNDACNGFITEIVYCYRYGRVAGYNVTFNLTVVILNSDYTILHTFYVVSQASKAINCVDNDQNRKCCDITHINLSMDPESFAFGVTVSDESEANLAYHESDTSNIIKSDVLKVPKRGLNLSKGSTDLQQFKGIRKSQITPRCVCLKSDHNNHLTRTTTTTISTTTLEYAESITTMNATSNTESDSVPITALTCWKSL